MARRVRQAKQRQPLVRVAVAVVLSLSAAGCETPWLEKIRQVTPAPQQLHGSLHRVALLEGGRDALLYRLARVRAARHSVRVQTFIWSDDEVAREFLAALVGAAERGVVVEVLSDGMFTGEASRTLLAAASRNANFRARLYRPVAAPTVVNAPYLLRRAILDWHGLNQRMHNKVMIFDDAIGIVGGRNVADEYFDGDTELNFLDLDIAVEGRVVRDMTDSFARYWEVATPLRATAFTPQTDASMSFNERKFEEGAAPSSLRWRDVDRVAFWADPPGKPEPETHRRSLAVRLAALLSGAKREVVLQTPYFILSPRAEELFAHLRQKKVRLRTSTNSLAATDNWLTYAHALRQRRTTLRDLDFEVWEMKPFPSDLARYIPGHERLRRHPEEPSSGPRLSLHSKALVIDDQIALVGSYNLDPRSANFDTEAAVLVRDLELANSLRRKIERDMGPGNSWTVARKERLLPVQVLTELVEEVNDIARSATTLDIWPLRYSALFELRPDAAPVPRDDPKFYENYDDVGLFPGVDHLDVRRILIDLTRTLSGPVEPLL